MQQLKWVNNIAMKNYIWKHLHFKTFTLHHHVKDNEVQCLILTQDVVCVKYVCFQCDFYGNSNLACV